LTDLSVRISTIYVSLAVDHLATMAMILCIGINETADNTGCGAPGDATHLLRALVEADLEPGVACFGWMYDPSALEACFTAGVGSTIENFILGGKLEVEQGGMEEPIAGGPIVCSAQVRVLTDGVCPARPGSVGYYGPGSKRSLGRMARVVINNIDVLINEVRTQSMDEGAFTLAGIDVSRYKICGIKSSTHFRAGWGELSPTLWLHDVYCAKAWLN
jgi:microcystin degradation protein MlrC